MRPNEHTATVLYSITVWVFDLPPLIHHPDDTKLKIKNIYIPNKNYSRLWYQTFLTNILNKKKKGVFPYTSSNFFDFS